MLSVTKRFLGGNVSAFEFMDRSCVQVVSERLPALARRYDILPCFLLCSHETNSLQLFESLTDHGSSAVFVLIEIVGYNTEQTASDMYDESPAYAQK